MASKGLSFFNCMVGSNKAVKCGQSYRVCGTLISMASGLQVFWTAWLLHGWV